MIDHQALLADLQKLLGSLEDDLRERLREEPALDRRLRAEHAAARDASRTAQSYEDWREEAGTQAAVAWTLACVFVRFLEDNALVATPRLAGPGARLQLARDHHTLYFQKHPAETEREYLLDVFRGVAALPAARELFHERHNPVWSLAPSGDGARALLQFWQAVEPATGALRHDFSDPEWNTRFLGDLYQDLSEAARKKYALLQTPEFVEEFILDRTLGPAVEEFGWRAVRLIDPTCGSGHFLLGAFRRLFELWTRHEPGTNVRELAQRALDAVCGVDLNPYAVAIARFRLLVAALRACGLERLQDAPAFRIHVAAGDSLLHGKRWLFGREGEVVAGTQRGLLDMDRVEHFYAAEDQEALDRLLGRQYHAVVGNPPYITVKDRALNNAYRQKYGSCHMKYSLAVPFMERFFELALPPAPLPVADSPHPAGERGNPAGFVGMITANSFMKREFGKKLIEEFIPRWDLTHVIDTSGAYIPGHGTPTVLLFGRNRRPVGDTLRAVMGIRGEPTTPDDPAHGQVWTAIASQVDEPGSTSEWVSASDAPRASFHTHPWSIGGGGAAELKELIEEGASRRLGDIAASIGITSFTLEDDIYLLPAAAARRHRLASEDVRPMTVGDAIRDWLCADMDVAVFPYDGDLRPIAFAMDDPRLRYLWVGRTCLAGNKMFGGQTKIEAGLLWYEFGRLTTEKLRTPLSLAYAEVATHNHFVLDRGGKVFKQTAPVIKLPEGASEDEHLALLGLLNSSTGCFWLRQVSHNKGGEGIGRGIADERWEKRFAFDASKVSAFPIPDGSALSLARELERLATACTGLMPDALVARATPTRAQLRDAREQAESQRRKMIALQEELDWQCYRLYALLDDDLTSASLDAVPEIDLGERAFEIVLARRLAAGEVQTAWFERHGSTPVSEVPARWPADYRRLVERRLHAIETNAHIRLIEQPEYKRRWNSEPWESRQERALRGFLLDRLESPAYWPAAELTTCARLADRAHADPDFMQAAELYRARADFQVAELVRELVEAEAVPFLPVLRYKDSGLRKREQWERTWKGQRQEDALDRLKDLPEGHPERLTAEEAQRRKAQEVGEIPVPPKYTSADFKSGTFWRLRGKLDVPKERFIAYPGCERDADPSPVVGWAGWDHLKQAQALAAYYVSMKDNEGWPAERLTPLLAGLLELLPWLAQWHAEIDPAYGLSMAEYFRRFVEEEARALALTLDRVRAWQPAAKPRARSKKTPASSRT